MATQVKQRLVSGTKSDDVELGDHEHTECLTKEQCDALVDARQKDRIFRLLCLSAMVDTAGSSLLSPAYAMAVSNAPGSVAPEGGVHPDAFPNVTVSFSLATNLIFASLVLGGIISSLVMGSCSDRYGRKPLIITGLLGGAAGYLLMYTAAAVLRSYYIFLVAMFVNGLFSGTKGVMMSYLADVYSPAEFSKKQPVMGTFILFGGSGGGLLGGVIISATGQLWVAAWVGVLASLVFAGVIGAVMTEPRRKTGDAGADAAAGGGDDAADLITPSATLAILKLCILAGVLDALGDEGNKFARTTIMPQRYPATKEPATMAMIASSNVIATLFCKASRWKPPGRPSSRPAPLGPRPAYRLARAQGGAARASRALLQQLGSSRRPGPGPPPRWELATSNRQAC